MAILGFRIVFAVDVLVCMFMLIFFHLELTSGPSTFKRRQIGALFTRLTFLRRRGDLLNILKNFLKL